MTKDFKTTQVYSAVANLQSYAKIDKGMLNIIHQMLMVIISLIFISNLFSLMFSDETDMYYDFTLKMDFVLCIFFLGDFFYNWAKSSNKSHYFFRRLGWLDLLSSIPYTALSFTASYSGLGFIRVVRIMILFVRVFRSLRDVNRLVVYLAEKSMLFCVVCLSIAVMIPLTFISSTLYLHFEGVHQTGLIQSVFDSLWWSFMTTISFGEMIPHTYVGKAVATVSMVCGILFYGAVGGLLTSRMIDFNDKIKKKQLNAMADRIEKLEQKIDSLLFKNSIK